MSETLKYLADRADEIIEFAKTKENSSEYLNWFKSQGQISDSSC